LLTGFTGLKPGESNPVNPVNPVENAQRHSAANAPIPSEVHRFFHVVEDSVAEIGRVFAHDVNAAFSVTLLILFQRPCT
jgi:hypothetical protein